MNVIKCTDLTKSYGQQKALDNLSVTIEENKITGLVGRNGAGKTTLLKILAGFWRVSSGEVNVFSRKPFDNLFVSANTMFVDDQMNFPTALTLKEILEQAGRFYDNWDMELAERLFDYFSFRPGQNYSVLSKGKKSTFNMIVGLCSRCRLTIFDEPTTGMDTAVRKDFYRALLKDYLAHPRSIIISSHHVDEVEEVLEDVLLVESGQKFLHMPIEDLKEYAIALNGPSEDVNKWRRDREVLHTKTAGNNTYAVVTNDFEQHELEQINLAGIDMSSVSPGDLCVYLTDRAKGGIDDVFDKA
ncbi:ATP-binding cassette domain-containing protein [Lentibacillus sp. CBA3610]|uniref:ATP-binding cassette domain-containing protein n=1 Tax=Lentibacillus sp. CBA3610 TaxID=2518176 RepID=UPI0015958223|nr:ABC transporter ATP-binding protein [Lentibacillus sp. CBA3610]QKY71059.1 ABC transporter ATP-binding protein [Lentibacillus sp. CBA3610]